MRIDIPLTHAVDLLVFGATSGAVEAAVAAAGAGCSVLCVTRYTYPGEDICAPMAYWPDEPYPLTTELGRNMMPAGPAGQLPRPMHIKYTLEQALIRAGVQILYMTHGVRLLRRADGRIGGAVIANRSGFQAVAARTIIDATERALMARLVPDAPFQAFTPGTFEAGYVVAGDQPAGDAAARLTRLSGAFDTGERQLTPYRSVTEHRFQAPTVPAMAAVDTASRLAAWYPGQLLAADMPALDLHDGLRPAVGSPDTWRDAASFDLDACRVGHDPVYVLGPLAGVRYGSASALAQPGPSMAVGRRLGEYLAGAMRSDASAAASRDPKARASALQVDHAGHEPVTGLDVVRRDRYFRARDAASLAMELNHLPVLAQFDVVVAGGGTAGAPAGIAAARAGATTLILEYLPGLGGMTTRGRIASYYHGNRCGFTSEIDAGVHAMGEGGEFDPSGPRWNTEWKEQWFLQTALDAGAQVWFHALTVAAAVDGDRVGGVVVATPYGFGLVQAGTVVDASGNADVAAAAGARTDTIQADHVAVQGTGLAPLIPGKHYTNTDHTFIDDTDAADVTRAFAVARTKFQDDFDLTLVVDSRQRQQIHGDLTLQPVDFLAGRTFPDTITTARSNFDSHGFTVHPVFMAKPPDKESHWAHVPLRCLLPAGLEGILVTGLGVSCHRDALPVIRMQPDVQNQGYAAGRAAAMAGLDGVTLRRLDVKRLQHHLVEVGILQPDVPGHEDSFPLQDDAFRDAVDHGLDTHRGLAVIFSDASRSLPLLRQAYAAEGRGADRLRLALVMALLGAADGVETLIAAVDAAEWDQGWNYTGMGQFGFSLSPLDSMLTALGRAGDRRALPAIRRKLESLGPEREFSHFRALTLALERIQSVAAAPGLAALLEQVEGNAVQTLREAVRQPATDRCDTSERNRELKELVLARGLLACGDHQDAARRILAAYSNDLHGHYARHARAVLEAWR